MACLSLAQESTANDDAMGRGACFFDGIELASCQTEELRPETA